MGSLEAWIPTLQSVCGKIGKSYTQNYNFKKMQTTKDDFIVQWIIRQRN